MESACGPLKRCIAIGCPGPVGIDFAPGGDAMRIPTRPLFRPFDYALIVAFAMAFVMLTTLRLA